MSDDDDKALRPSLPPDQDGQVLYYLRQSAVATMQVANEMQQLRALIVGSPSLVERITAGRPRNAIATLIVVVSLSALVGSAVALAWAP
jgi:hypothetical protein